MYPPLKGTLPLPVGVAIQRPFPPFADAYKFRGVAGGGIRVKNAVASRGGKKPAGGVSPHHHEASKDPGSNVPLEGGFVSHPAPTVESGQGGQASGSPQQSAQQGTQEGASVLASLVANAQHARDGRPTTSATPPLLPPSGDPPALVQQLPKTVAQLEIERRRQERKTRLKKRIGDAQRQYAQRHAADDAAIRSRGLEPSRTDSPAAAPDISVTTDSSDDATKGTTTMALPHAQRSSSLNDVQRRARKKRLSKAEYLEILRQANAEAARATSSDHHRSQSRQPSESTTSANKRFPEIEWEPRCESP